MHGLQGALISQFLGGGQTKLVNLVVTDRSESDLEGVLLNLYS